MPYTPDPQKPALLDENADIRRAQAALVAAGAIGTQTVIGAPVLALVAVCLLSRERARISLERLSTTRRVLTLSRKLGLVVCAFDATHS